MWLRIPQDSWDTPAYPRTLYVGGGLVKWIPQVRNSNADEALRLHEAHATGEVRRSQQSRLSVSGPTGRGRKWRMSWRSEMARYTAAISGSVKRFMGQKLRDGPLVGGKVKVQVGRG